MVATSLLEQALNKQPPPVLIWLVFVYVHMYLHVSVFGRVVHSLGVPASFLEFFLPIILLSSNGVEQREGR